jgi:acetyl-CoA C-acetyltransferase
MSDIVILGAARTAIGAFQGALKDLPAPALGARAIAGALERAGLEPSQVEQVNMGCVLTAGIGQAPARQASIKAGIPYVAGALTVGKVCGSGMRAAMIAANDLRCGDFRVVVAGGMESMSNAPYLAPGARDGLRLGHGKFLDSMILDGLWDPYNDLHMGNCAELCVRKYDISRAEQDAYSVESYRRAREATESGTAGREIVAVELPQKKGEPLRIERDEEPFKSDLSRIGGLRPAFEKDGTVTAGNASKINDGAAALVLTTADHAARLGKTPLARIVAHASAAQEPEWFTTAPVAATRRVLERAGLQAKDIDLWEINEAFAVVPMQTMRNLGVDPEKVNVNGGAIALGHPLGATGAMLLGTAIDELERRGLGTALITLCIGGGQAVATIVERV